MSAPDSPAGEPAFRVDGRSAGRAAFYDAACDPRRSVVVEACAGSGKTWLLVARMLRTLLDGAEPHEMLAITFTRAAAGEMRERLADWIARWSSPRSSHAERVQALVERGLDPARAEAMAPQLGALRAKLLAGGRPVQVRTFHAWFAQLLRAAPLELLDRLGLQPDMSLVEDIDEHRGAVFRTFHAAVLRSADLAADFYELTRERGRTQLGKWLDAAWRRRVEIELADLAGVLEGSVPPAAALWPELADLGDPADALASATWNARLRDLAGTLEQGGLTARNAAAGLHAALARLDPRERFVAAWSALHTEAGSRRKHLGTSLLLADACDALAHVSAQIAQHDGHLEHARMVRLARVLLAEFAAYKRSKGLADMADLERCALALLRDDELSGWVQERLDARVRHLFIDEFQDTSPLQWHALHAWLSAYTGAGGGSSGQRPPSVFIVGDPKQSLYRFRGAEPRVFEAAASFVVDGLDGRRLACDHTRRSAPAVVAALNTVFAAANDAGEFTGFRRHTTEVVAHEGDAVLTLGRVDRTAPAGRPAGAEPVWRDSLLVPREEVEEALREREAELVAATIGALLATTGSIAGEIKVLARKRQSLRFAAAALQRVHIAHGAVEEATLMDATEAQDLVALLDVLASPQHGLSLARALKSPIFGASDTDLVALADAAASTAHWWHALQGMAAPSAALARARELLARWALAAAQLPPHDLLDRIVHEGELRLRTLAAVPAEQRHVALASIDAVLAQALVLDAARYATPYRFVRALKRRVVKSPPPLRADAVRLLTIHGAKGLEADTVFVMDVDAEAPKSETTTVLVEWPVESEWPVRCAFAYSEARCPPSLAQLLASEHAARERETLNALYVAMTRARRRLVFSATAPQSRDPRLSWWQRLEAVAAPLAAEAELFAPGMRPAPAPASLKLMPGWQRAGRPGAGDAVPAIASASDGSAATAALGRAVHRVLEWAGGQEPGAARIVELSSAAAREFGAASADVERNARAIIESPDCARFFRGPGIVWSGNEVAVADAGEPLRIDRLVLVAGGEPGRALAAPSALGTGIEPEWWVLDYKLHHAPEALAAYREQLLRYRAAVARAEPAARVRCAFITGRGEVVEVEPEGAVAS